jgi:serine/threonine protein kinase
MQLLKKTTKNLIMEQRTSTYGHSSKSESGRRRQGAVEASRKSKISEQKRENDCSSPTRHVKRIHAPALNSEDLVVGALIGKGSFSEVHELTGFNRQARHALECAMDSHGFVIKHLRKGLSSAGSKVFIKLSRDLNTEATFLARLDHPHILKPRACVSTGTSHGSFGLILDRLDVTLLEKIDQWKFEQREQPMKDATFLVDRLCYALEIAEALEYVHDRRLIYRDLSPRNIGFKNNSIQLFDFGLCRELPSRSLAFGTDERYSMTYAGTARYLAPEVHRRKGYNLKADVYSWAIVCYEMISLIEPYEGMDRQEHYTEVCCEGFRPCMDDLPRSDDLEELLHQTWCESLRDRLSMKEVCEVLEEIIASTDPETREDPSPIDEELYVNDETESTCSTLSVDSWLSDDD